jgi:Cu/Zn superoxide dismutase
MQRFTLVLALLLAACATSKSNDAGPAAGSSSPADLASQGNVFKATLSADMEVPKPTVDASKAPSGTATFTVTPASVSYQVKVMNLSSAYTACHIHAGPAGVAGPVIVPLTLTPGSDGTASGEGTFDTSALKGKMPDGTPMTMANFVAALRAGTTYINVHTANNKPGEARGQIQ